MTTGSRCSPAESQGNAAASAACIEAEIAGLFKALAEVGEFGAQPGAGITRLAGSAADGQARRYLVDWLNASGASVRVDAAGNIFGLFKLAAGDEAPTVMSGSHLDSQANAGALDGVYGVLAACSAGRALLRARQGGQRFTANFCVVNWSNEEGARFQPSMLGSGVFAGKHSAEFAHSRSDGEGIRFADALRSIGFLGSDPPPRPCAYLELHIEQGPQLERAGVGIGVVTGNWGAAKYEVSFIGEQAHTGPTPMPLRRDALLGAAHAITAIRAISGPVHAQEPQAIVEGLHTSVGRMTVMPNSPNVVPSRAELFVELRSLSEPTLAKAMTQLDQALEAAAATAGVRLELGARSIRAARSLSEPACRWIEDAAARLGLTTLRLPTVSGHDALNLLDLCPVGMIFVPSKGGISHHHAESTEPSDLEAGLRVLTETLWSVCAGPIDEQERPMP